jgi:hypothetical protein
MPTGFEIQKRYDDLKADLSASALREISNKQVQISLRQPDNSLQVMTINADKTGTLDAGEVAAVQTLVDGMKVAQDNFNSAKTTFDLANTSENAASISRSFGEYVAI